MGANRARRCLRALLNKLYLFRRAMIRPSATSSLAADDWSRSSCRVFRRLLPLPEALIGPPCFPARPLRRRLERDCVASLSAIAWRFMPQSLSHTSSRECQLANDAMPAYESSRDAGRHY